MKAITMALLLLWLLAVLLGRFVELNPNQVDLNAVLQGPSQGHWLGTDELGRDILSRVLRGVEISLSVAVIVTGITMLIGVTVGLLAGFYGGKLDACLMQITSILMAFPGLLLAIALAAMLGAGFSQLVIALCCTGWVNYARLTRGQALSLRQRPYVLSAIALGAGPWRVMFKHVLPMLFSVLVVEATYSLGSVMIAEASLSFLGLGIQAPQASWGGMLRDAARFMLIAPHYVLAVGTCMMSLLLAVNLGGDLLRDARDVRREFVE